jgi:hypothetical protein
MNKKISEKNKICSNCKNMIISGMIFFHEQTEKNQFNLFCFSCALNISLNRLSKFSEKIKGNFSI